jgi:prophage regulatory protein
MTMHSRIEVDNVIADRLIRMPELLERTGLSRTTIYRRMAKGTFPQAVPIGANSCAWHASVVDRWIAEPMAWQE